MKKALWSVLILTELTFKTINPVDIFIIPWTGDQHIASFIPIQQKGNKNKCGHEVMLRFGLECVLEAGY
jgi:hypothetical protein